jgi:glycosyltransferase involved in cell wall biosynthesis
VVNSKSTLYALKHGVASPKRLAAANLDDIEPSAVSANPSKYQVVYCGCAIDQFTNGSKKADGSVTVALVGRITEWKGQHIFLKAASDVLKQFKNVRFQIIGAPLFGEEEYEQRLHQMVETLHIKDSVDFLGFRTDIPGLLSKADILVHASTIGEPFGQVVVEGMAAGKPVIATDGGALPELILDGETGILVPMGNASKMADKIIELLSNSASAQKMGAAARARSQSLFDVTRTARKIEAIYDLILKRNSATIAQPNSTAKLIDTQETS